MKPAKLLNRNKKISFFQITLLKYNVKFPRIVVKLMKTSAFETYFQNKQGASSFLPSPKKQSPRHVLKKKTESMVRGRRGGKGTENNRKKKL